MHGSNRSVLLNCLVGKFSFAILVRQYHDRNIKLTTENKINWIIQFREYYIIYEGPGFLAIIWFGSSPTPFFLQLIALFLSLHVWGRRG